jgi:hypothetical protein
MKDKSKVPPKKVKVPMSRQNLLRLGAWVAVKQAEYKAKDDAGTISDWEMDVLNWLDTYKELGRKAG